MGMGYRAKLRKVGAELRTLDHELNRLVHARERARYLSAIAASKPLAKTPRRDRPLCGARTRNGAPCRRRPVWNDFENLPRNGRCVNHGGLSTGPRVAHHRSRDFLVAVEGYRRERERRRAMIERRRVEREQVAAMTAEEGSGRRSPRRRRT
jgi:hypothetical protein